MTILIISPDTDWSAKAMQSFLIHGMPCETAHTGKTAQLMAYQKSYDYFILDLDVQNHPAIEVCLYLRKNLPKSKVLLTASSPERLGELSLDEKKAVKLGGTKLLFQPSPEQLVQEIFEIGKIRYWRHLKEIAPANEVSAVESIEDQIFTRIKVSDLFEDSLVAFDFYARIEPHKFQKILHKGERATKERIQSLSSSGTDYLFFHKTSRATFISYQNDLAQETLKSSPHLSPKVVHASKAVCDKYFEEILSTGIQQQLIEEGKLLCQNIHTAAKNGGLKKFVKDPDLFNPVHLSHSFMISIFTALICQDLDWVGPKTLEALSLGALYHDIGILQLPAELQDLDPGLMNPEQTAIYQTHPQLGAEALKACAGLNVGVTQIVLQHHELINGSGFPGKLSGNQIYPLAKIVSLADSFSYFLKEQELSPVDGLKTFLRDQNNLLCYDPILIKSLIKAIK